MLSWQERFALMQADMDALAGPGVHTPAPHNRFTDRFGQRNSENSWIKALEKAHEK